MGAEWGNGRGLITRELADSRIARRGPEQPLKLPRWFEFAANDLVARIVQGHQAPQVPGTGTARRASQGCAATQGA